MLATTADTTQYNSFFQAQASAINANDTGSSSQFGLLWDGGSADPACSGGSPAGQLRSRR